MTCDMSDQNQLSSIHFKFLIISVYISNFATVLDSGLSASSYVEVASSFNLTNLSTWPVNAFLVSSMTVQPIFARVSDRYGRQVPYLFALGIFSTGTALAAVSPWWEVLILARLLCGIGVGGLMILGSVLVTEAVGLEKRGYYQSMNYVVYGTGSAIGSASGGTIAQTLGWRWIFKCQVPIALLSLLLFFLFVSASPHHKSQTSTRAASVQSKPGTFDWSGSFCFSAFLITLCGFLTTGGNILPWSHPFIVFTGICTAALFNLLLYLEAKSPAPILPLDILTKRVTRNLIVVGFLFSMINYMVIYNIPMFFQTVLLESPSVAGLHLVIPSISFTVVATVTATAIARLGDTKPTLYLSQSLLAFGSAGLVVMVSIFPSLGISGWVYNMILMFPAAGASMMAPSAFLTLLNGVEKDDIAAATAGFTTARSLGVLVAAALGTTTVQNTFRFYFSNSSFNNKRTAIEDARKNIDSISSLDTNLRKQVQNAFAIGYTTLFIVCFIASLAILLSTRSLKVTGILKAKDQQESSSTYELLELESDDER